MSKADEIFIRNCREIIDHGIWDTEMNVRPHWEDGTPAHTVKRFGIVNRYDLSEEFPILTLRKTYWKSAIDELAISIGQVLTPTLQQIVGHVQGFVDKLNSMDPATKEMIATVGVVVAALSPVLIIIGTVISAVGNIIMTIGKLIPIVKGAAAVIAGVNPVVALVVAAIAALIAIGVALYQNWDVIKAKAKIS